MPLLQNRFRPLLAESLGTLILVTTVVGSGIMAERLSTTNTGVALLGNTLATAAVLVVLIELLGPISGAHLNPAVSLAELAQGRLNRQRLGAFIGVQAIGALMGTTLAHAMFRMPVLGTGLAARTGPDQWLGELVATAGLVVTVNWGCCKPAKRVAPLVALWITAGYWFTSSTSFANPAVTLARAFTPSFSGIRPQDVAWFWLAQVIGALVGVGISRLLGYACRSTSHSGGSCTAP